MAVSGRQKGLYLPHAIIAALRDHAFASGRTESAIATEALGDWLERHPMDADQRARIKQRNDEQAAVEKAFKDAGLEQPNRRRIRTQHNRKP